MQAGRRHGVADGGDGNAAGLDEERGLLGVRDFFEEGNGGLMGRMTQSKEDNGGLSILVGEGRVGADLEKGVDVEGCCVRFPAHAGAM